MTSPLHGRCACGAVRFELDPPTLFASCCHCETCRRAHAAPLVAWTAVPRERYRVIAGEEEIQSYVSSPGVSRGFCRRCGTHVRYLGDSTPDRVYVPVAALDGLDRLLDGHVSYEEAPGWARGLERLPCYREKGSQRLAWG